MMVTVGILLQFKKQPNLKQMKYFSARDHLAQVEFIRSQVSRTHANTREPEYYQIVNFEI